MTGYVNSGDNPTSMLTIASLQDLGYDVDYTKAGIYNGYNMNNALENCCRPNNWESYVIASTTTVAPTSPATQAAGTEAAQSAGTTAAPQQTGTTAAPQQTGTTAAPQQTGTSATQSAEAGQTQTTQATQPATQAAGQTQTTQAVQTTQAAAQQEEQTSSYGNTKKTKDCVEKYTPGNGGGNNRCKTKFLSWGKTNQARNRAMKKLRNKKLKKNEARTKNGVTYVGDQKITMLVVEDGTLFEVEVDSDGNAAISEGAQL